MVDVYWVWKEPEMEAPLVGVNVPLVADIVTVASGATFTVTVVGSPGLILGGVIPILTVKVPNGAVQVKTRS